MDVWKQLKFDKDSERTIGKQFSVITLHERLRNVYIFVVGTREWV